MPLASSTAIAFREARRIAPVLREAAVASARLRMADEARFGETLILAARREAREASQRLRLRMDRERRP